MGNLAMQPWQWALAFVAAGVAAVGVILAPATIKEKFARFKWWFFAAGLVALGWLFLVFLRRRMPSDAFPASALPDEFRPGYWGWMYAFLVGGIAAGVGFVEQLRAARRRAGAGPESAFPEIDAAWEEILVRLAAARIDPSSQRFTLILAPDEDAPAALIESAGLQVFAHAPGGPAPIHAHATSDGVLLSLSGASRLGAPGDPAAEARLRHVCRLLLALAPDRPVTRAMVVVLPIGWCSRPESMKEAATVRDDIATILRILDVRCPAYAVVSGMEETPGFAEFAGRLGSQVSRQMTDQRVGFGVPASEGFSGELVNRGLIWQSGWFHVWALNLLAGDPLNEASNANLYLLDAEFRRYRRRLRSILESAFATHQGAGPALFRGCYFAATGAGRGEKAFAAGLFRGARARVIADHVLAEWTPEAARADRRYLWAAAIVGGIGLAACLGTWAFVATRAAALGWAGLVAIPVAWLAAIAWMIRRG